MAPLNTELRKQLENAIREARRLADPGARRALEALAVDRAKPHPSMGTDEQGLRRRLRAHGRQLGDQRERDPGTQEVTRLAHEVAYEHWHRMLFARFLAENHLLIEPDSGVAISLAECEELARERGEDPWAFAGRAAARMLPRIFRPDDPALEVSLAPETRKALEKLLADLPAGVFTADDSLGWTYQFWQAERKEEVNRSGVRIGADELPAVTQLFTEHYMVQFLLHNTIGAWRAGKLLVEQPELAARAESEEALSRAVRLEGHGGYDFSYLRFVREAREGDEEGQFSGAWRPAAGTFETWPRRAAEIRVLDPCCGSGHFLVEAFELLVRLRMEEEGLALDEGIHAVLADNLFGLEIDPRCTQIAAFNLALAAWKLAGKPIELPPVHIACTGLEVRASAEQWERLAHDDKNLRLAMRWLYDEFQNARELGSLIDPAQTRAAKLVPWDQLQPLLQRALAREEVQSDPEATEAGITAQGLARAAEILAGKFTLVVTNVPYLGRSNQTRTLQAFAENDHNEAKADLATLFVSRAFRWLGAGSSQAVVTPQNWLFLTRYRKLRERILRSRAWNLVARLGPGAFETIGGHVVNVALCVLSADHPKPDRQVVGIDVSAHHGQRPIPARKKAALLRGDNSRQGSDRTRGAAMVMLQSQMVQNPDAVIQFGTGGAGGALLGRYAETWQGIVTCDDNRFLGLYWEIGSLDSRWRRTQQPPQATRPYTAKNVVILWADGRGPLHKDSRAHNFPPEVALERHGIAVQRMAEMNASLITGEVFGDHVAPLLPSDRRLIAPIWCYAESGLLRVEVRRIDPQVKVAVGSLLKVPFDLAHWQGVAAEKYPNGLPEPYSDDPTQWIFHGHPCGSVIWDEARKWTAEGPLRTDATVLQVAISRVLGYRWPAEQDPEMRLAAEQRAWVDRCRALEPHADRDGIVCIPALRGEVAAANRLRHLLAAAYGDEWSATKEHALLAAAAEQWGGAPAATLEEWLRDRFFEEHSKLFHHRPFIWHIWDGRKDGFHALVNYHHLAGPGGEGRRTLEALAYSYLGDWIERQKTEQREGKPGSDARLAAALDLQSQLGRILEGEPPCDLFVRWKPLQRQPIGWEPDIDDGVRPNIRPFLRAELRTGGRKGAGILRWKPNVKWTKDRGKEPRNLRPKEDFPWFCSAPGDGTEATRTDFEGGDSFDGNRWNDFHYTNATKRAARGRAKDAASA